MNILNSFSGIRATRKHSPNQLPNTPAGPPSATAAAVKPTMPMPSAQAQALAQTHVPLSSATLAAAAGLPADSLSTTIVSFARFFSLPLKPELLAAIRRQAFLPAPQPGLAKTAAGPETSLMKESLLQKEAFSLAATAAESKGLKLNAGGLEAYAAAIDPEQRERNRERGGKEQRDENRDGGEKENTRKAALASEGCTASGIRETALESAEKNPLLAVLNRLPGKDGRRWIVLPFTYNNGGKEWQISMRVLLEGGAHMVLDITETASSEKQKRFIFFAETVSSGTPAQKLTVYLPSEFSQGDSQTFAENLSRHTGIPPDFIKVETLEESSVNFPCESKLANDLLAFHSLFS